MTKSPIFVKIFYTNFTINLPYLKLFGTRIDFYGRNQKGYYQKCTKEMACLQKLETGRRIFIFIEYY